ncbi:hypothetical protein [Vibrio nigripulchritudo]|uniref:hypothetical protein n=1 Tax=Vibrio nigripulchritudo TaxID=28173 RepID=UPI00249023CD|nr:hypothetical protein [Vibrio nigripulchritudo]BDU42886.1 hypothetical protein TUMSATVNIG3_16840 [Vibrio nigripulchritudo]
MNKQAQTTSEIEKEINKVTKNPFAKAFTAPLRLLVVWMKATNDRLDKLEQQAGAVNGE